MLPYTMRQLNALTSRIPCSGCGPLVTLVGPLRVYTVVWARGQFLTRVFDSKSSLSRRSHRQTIPLQMSPSNSTYPVHIV
jgi:hypothetical protein